MDSHKYEKEGSALPYSRIPGKCEGGGGVGKSSFHKHSKDWFLQGSSMDSKCSMECLTRGKIPV